MRISDILYFSPRYKFSQIDPNNKELLIEAFRDRVGGFYLKPARILNEKECAFGAGVLCATAIDFLARIAINSEKVGERIEKWLTENIQEFDETLAHRFYKEFRNGLVHEGRIKNCGQFSYDFEEMIHLENGIMIVNPKLLLEKISDSFGSYTTKILADDSAFQLFRDRLEADFKEDIRRAQG